MVNNIDAVPALLHNVSGNRNHWLGVRLVGGTKSPRDVDWRERLGDGKRDEAAGRCYLWRELCLQFGSAAALWTGVCHPCERSGGALAEWQGGEVSRAGGGPIRDVDGGEGEGGVAGAVLRCCRQVGRSGAASTDKGCLDGLECLASTLEAVFTAAETGSVWGIQPKIAFLRSVD